MQEIQNMEKDKQKIRIRVNKPNAPILYSMGTVSRKHFITLVFEVDVNGTVTYRNKLYCELLDSLQHKSERKQVDYRNTQLNPDLSLRP